MLRSLPCRLPPSVLVRAGDPFRALWRTLLSTFLHRACRNNGSLQPLADSVVAGASASGICRDPASFREGAAACLDPGMGVGRSEPHLRLVVDWEPGLCGRVRPAAATGEEGEELQVQCRLAAARARRPQGSWLAGLSLVSVRGALGRPVHPGPDLGERVL